MPTTVTFDFTDARSGKVTKTVLLYAAATGWANCQTGQDIIGDINYRAIFSFDTSALPDAAVIQSVEFFQQLADSQPPGDPADEGISYSLGTWIGSPFAGVQGDYDGGTDVHFVTGAPATGWIVFDPTDALALINRSGYTDLKVSDGSWQDVDNSWGTAFNTAGSKCQLRVTYEMSSADLVQPSVVVT